MDKPKVVMTDKVFQDMIQETLKYPTIETAWGLVGYVHAGRNVFITNVIPPAPEDIVRRSGTVSIGGPYQLEQIDWLARDQLKMRNAKKNAAYEQLGFHYIYSGHSHHTMGLKAYSGVDIRSIEEAITKSKLVVAIGPLANITRNDIGNSWSPLRTGNVLEASQNVELRFYYLSKEMVDNHKYSPMLIPVTVIPERESPVLIPRLAWRYSSREYFLSQVRLMEEKGISVKVMNRDLPQYKHMAVQFLLRKEGWKSPLVINTQWNFPEKSPDFEIRENGKNVSIKKIDFYRSVYTNGMDLVESVVLLEKAGRL